MVSAPTSLASLGAKDLLQVKLIWRHSRIYLRVTLLYCYFDFWGLRDVDREVLSSLAETEHCKAYFVAFEELGSLNFP